MIKSFANKETKKLYVTGKSKKFTKLSVILGCASWTT